MTASLQWSRFNNRAEERQRNESKRRVLLSGLRITGLRTSTGLEWSQRGTEGGREGVMGDERRGTNEIKGGKKERQQVFRMERGKN